jgi:predicted amidohydrolase
MSFTGMLATSAFAADEPTGRPVRIVSLSFHDKPLEEIARVVDSEGAKGADLIALPETWRGQGDGWETLEGPTVTAMAALAKRHHTYIVCPIDRRDGERRLNSAVLIDREGKIVCVYDKVYPYWAEFDVKPPVSPGSEVRVYQADFGRIGMATCFDVNFPEVWQRLADQGAELVIWPSAYSAGTSLQAHALNHHYYIVTSTWTCDCIVYDITGEEMLYQKSEGLNVTRVTLDLDRCIFHQNFNIEKRDTLLKDHPDDVEQEKWLDREQWFVLGAKRPGVSARALARQYGMEQLRDYLDRSRRDIDKMRGGPLGRGN